MAAGSGRVDTGRGVHLLLHPPGRLRVWWGRHPRPAHAPADCAARRSRPIRNRTAERMRIACVPMCPDRHPRYLGARIRPRRVWSAGSLDVRPVIGVDAGASDVFRGPQNTLWRGKRITMLISASPARTAVPRGAGVAGRRPPALRVCRLQRQRPDGLRRRRLALQQPLIPFISTHGTVSSLSHRDLHSS